MNRIATAGTVLAALLALALPAGAAADDVTAEEAMARAQALYSPGGRHGCSAGGGDEIVVCARRQRDEHVPSTAESDPNSREARHALDNGVPRAPQLDRGSCRGQAGCFIGGWAPPPLYIIDLKAIPEAPEGSDADRIGKGEMAQR